MPVGFTAICWQQWMLKLRNLGSVPGSEGNVLWRLQSCFRSLSSLVSLSQSYSNLPHPRPYMYPPLQSLLISPSPWLQVPFHFPPSHLLLLIHSPPSSLYPSLPPHPISIPLGSKLSLTGRIKHVNKTQYIILCILIEPDISCKLDTWIISLLEEWQMAHEMIDFRNTIFQLKNISWEIPNKQLEMNCGPSLCWAS